MNDTKKTFGDKTKYSEWIHREFPPVNFELTGDYNNDTQRYMEENKITDDDLGRYAAKIKTSALRISFGPYITVHTLTDGVVEKIKYVKLENMPKERPQLMQHSFLIEARHDKMLLDDILSIGGFIADDVISLLLATNSGNVFHQTIPKSFDGMKLDDLNMLNDYDREYATAENIVMRNRKDFFSFALKFALMIEAERTPFVVETKKNKRHNGNKPKLREKSDWIERRVYIDRTIKYKRTGKGNGSLLDKDGKQLKDTPVHGFLRLQPCGPGRSESRYIYIDDYNSKRWVNTGDTKIIVDLYEK